jgi:hypothetical protein
MAHILVLGGDLEQVMLMLTKGFMPNKTKTKMFLVKIPDDERSTVDWQ